MENSHASPGLLKQANSSALHRVLREKGAATRAQLAAAAGVSVTTVRALLEEMPPFLTGGEMIESVTREGAVFAEAPHKFEAGTVNAAGAAGLHAAIDYVERVGFDTIHARELAVTADALARMRALPHVRILGSDKAEEHNGILTFAVDNVHPHDVSELLAADGVAVRAGHHCAEPLHRFLGYHATVRASFAFYNDKTDVDRLVGSLSTVRGRMGYDD